MDLIIIIINLNVTFVLSRVDNLFISVCISQHSIRANFTINLTMNNCDFCYGNIFEYFKGLQLVT